MNVLTAFSIGVVAAFVISVVALLMILYLTRRKYFVTSYRTDRRDYYVPRSAPSWDLSSAEGALEAIEETIQTASGWKALDVEIMDIINEYKAHVE